MSRSKPSAVHEAAIFHFGIKLQYNRCIFSSNFPPSQLLIILNQALSNERQRNLQVPEFKQINVSHAYEPVICHVLLA